MPYVWFAFICVVWSSSFILMKKATLFFSPAEVALLRLLGGAAILAVLWLLRPQRLSLKRTDALAFCCVVLLGFAWPFAIQPYLVARHGSAFIGMLVAFTPLLTILVALVLGNYPAPRQIVGVLGALVCLCLLLFESRDRNVPVIDLVLAITVPGGYAVTNTLIRRALPHVRSLELTLLALIAAALTLVPVVGLAQTAPVRNSGALVTAATALGFLGIVGTGLSSWVFNRLIHDQGPLFAAMATNLVPIGAIFLGWADAEQVTPLQVGAVLGLIAMVSLVQYGAATVRPDPS